MPEVTVTRERRVYKRIPVRCPVRFRFDDQECEGSSKDLSASGLGLFTHAKLESGIHLVISLKLTPKIQPLHIDGQVIWADEKQPGLWRAGIEFDELAFVKIVQSLTRKKLSYNREVSDGV